MAIVILEGSDCTGKTTFCEMLAEKTGYEILKGSSFKISELGADGMFEHMMNLLDKKNIIIDRFFYSNLVYGKLYNYPMMRESQYMRLANRLNETALVVYLHANPITIAERMNIRGDDMVKVDDIYNILEGYKKEMNGIFAPKLSLSFDTTESNFNVATSLVKEFVDLNEYKMYFKA